MLPALPGKMLEHHSSKVMTSVLRNNPPPLQLKTSVMMTESFPTHILHSLGSERCLERLSLSLYYGEARIQVTPGKAPDSSFDRCSPVILLGRIFIAERETNPFTQCSVILLEPYYCPLSLYRCLGIDFGIC